MNIFLTGGSGFIGRNILESALARKYTIKAPGHKELELMDENSVRDYIKNNKIDVIIHAAAKPGHRNAKDPAGIFYTNTRIFFNLARNADYYSKMIVTGSGAVYDMRYYQPKMKEEYAGTHVPLDEHGLSKYVIDRFIERGGNIYDLRIFGIFGKYEDYAIRFISNMICKAIFGLPMTMNQNRRFDYLYIDDLMPVLEYFIEETPLFHAYNVTPDSAVELLDIAGKILKLSGKNIPIRAALPGMGMEYSGDNFRLKKEMKNLGFTPLDDSIKDLMAYYENNKPAIDRNKLLIDK